MPDFTDFILYQEVITRIVDACCGTDEDPTTWNMDELNAQLKPEFDFTEQFELSKEDIQLITKEKLVDRIFEAAKAKYDAREEEFGAEIIRELERVITLRVVDSKWMDHIDDMDRMRQGIALRSYGQRDPLVEYQFISYDMFDELRRNIQTDIVRGMFHVRVMTAPEREQVAQPTSTNMDDSSVSKPKVRKEEKIGRNDLCPCGSGLKYKNCCGKDK